MGAAVRKERKLVTVLFADLVGFTARAESLDPEDVDAVLAPYHRHVRAELERFGGTVEKFIGDAVVAVYGAPVAHEDDPERAVRAALAIRDWARDEETLELRIAVNTGEALVTVGADSARGEAMVAGDVVNTASRLQSAAPTNGVLVGETTYRATERVIEYRETEPIDAKGKAERVAAWEALESRARATVEREARAPLVGRDRELALLVEALARARRQREPQLVTLVGVPGIGKSRLVYELFRSLEQSREFVYWRRGRSLPYGAGVTFSAVGEMVKAQVGILETDDSEKAAERLRAAVRGLFADRDAAWIERHLRPLVGLGSDVEPAGERRAEAFFAWRRFFERLAEDDPLVLVFEDLHWADDALLEFVDELVDEAGGIPLLVVGTARPEFLARRPAWGGGKPNALTLTLPPLSDAETARLVSELLGRPVIDAAVQARLLAHAGGNPLFAEEFVRLVDERGGELAVPESVQAIIAARLDALPAADKEVVQDAAVIGRTFWIGALAEISGREARELERALRALERREFVRRERRASVADETELVFRHALVRDVAYAQIPRAARAGKHRRVAEWIESLSERDDHVELVADHYTKAVEFARAAGTEDAELERRARIALREAGDRAAALHAHEAAARLYRRALDASPPGTPERPGLLLAAGRVLSLAELRGDDELVEAREALLQLGDREAAAEAELALAELVFRRDGDRAVALEHLARAESLVADGPPSRAQAWTLAQRARMLMLGKETEVALEVGRAALALADRLGLEDVRAHALNSVGLARVHVGDRDGLRDLEESLEIARRMDSAPLLLRAYNNLVAALELVGDMERSAELQLAGIGEAERFGQRALALVLKDNRAMALVALGDWDAALELASEVASEAERLRSNFRSSMPTGIRFARGEEEAALADARAEVARLRTMGLPGHLGQALLVLAWILSETGRRREALPFAEEALAVAESAPLAVAFPEAVALLLDLGRGDELRRVLAGAPPYQRFAAAREHAAGRMDRAAALYAATGDRTSEALVHLFAARAGGPDAPRHAEEAAAFFRSVGATRLLREAERLVAATA